VHEELYERMFCLASSETYPALWTVETMNVLTPYAYLVVWGTSLTENFPLASRSVKQIFIAGSLAAKLRFRLERYANYQYL
jgi:hypothetical protein